MYSRHEPLSFVKFCIIKCREVLSSLHSFRETYIGAQFGEFKMNWKMCELLLKITQQVSLHSLIDRRGSDAHVMPPHVWTPLGEPQLQEAKMMLRGSNGQDLEPLGTCGKKLSRFDQGPVSRRGCERRKTIPSGCNAAQIDGLRFFCGKKNGTYVLQQSFRTKMWMPRESNRDTLKFVRCCPRVKMKTR